MVFKTFHANKIVLLEIYNKVQKEQTFLHWSFFTKKKRL